MPERSPWVWVETIDDTDEHDENPLVSQQFLRKTGDGYLSTLVSFNEHLGWHMAVAFVSPRHARYPTWEEVLDAGEQLLPVGIIFVAAFQRITDGEIHCIEVHQHGSPLDEMPPLAEGFQYER